MSGLNYGKTYVFYSPNKLLFGLDSTKEVAKEVLQQGGKKVFIVTDPGVIEAGLLGPVETSLKSAGIPYFIYDQVEPEPPAYCVDKASDVFRSERYDLILGIGGGSSLDVAKGVSVMATNEGSVLDVCGVDKVKKRGGA